MIPEIEIICPYNKDSKTRLLFRFGMIIAISCDACKDGKCSDLEFCFLKRDLEDEKIEVF